MLLSLPADLLLRMLLVSLLAGLLVNGAVGCVIGW
jgi:hypothetical protein